MKICQILNNNVAVVKKGRSEMIVYSKGIAFRKKAGQTIGENEVERTYVLDSNEKLEHFSYLLAHTDTECLNIVNAVISFGETVLNEKMNDYLYLTILDHIDFALKRARKDQFIQSPLTWEVRKFYPKHFEIGMYALKLLRMKFGIDFPEDEAVSLALHFVNVQSNKTQLQETMQAVQVLKDMLSIIQYHYGICLDEKSLNYSRLITHLRYFIERLQNGQTYEDDDRDLNAQVQALYPEACACVQKIGVYVREHFHIELSVDEETYLILHIHRVTNKLKEL